LIFDHGCDSFTCVLVAMMLGKTIQVGNGYNILLVLVAVSQAFQFATLEEYYVGGLYLGIGNGVTDASVVIIALFTFCGFAGTEIWKNTVQLAVGN
jgi:hypothetical protein